MKTSFLVYSYKLIKFILQGITDGNTEESKKPGRNAQNRGLLEGLIQEGSKGLMSLMQGLLGKIMGKTEGPKENGYGQYNEEIDNKHNSKPLKAINL